MSTHPFTFQQVRKELGITLKAIAEASGISITRVYLYDIGARGVSQQDALQIIDALKHLTGTSATLDEVEQPTMMIPCVQPTSKVSEMR